MIDSHCHLTDERLLAAGVGEVVRRAGAVGVEAMVTIATTPEDAVGARKLADEFPEVWFVAGIHPNNSGPYVKADLDRLREFIRHPKCVAVGEMGLDYHWKDVPVAHQREMFVAQLELAGELEKPVVIHCREAVADALGVMAKYPTIRAVYHCFTGSEEEGRAIGRAGYSVGFTGPATFKKNDGLRKVIGELPADRILIETDAPYLTPEPHRSVRVNEPMYVRYVLQTVSQVRGISLAEADALTTANTKRLYGMG